MAVDGKALSRARDRLAALRESHEALRRQRQEEVYAKAPELRRTDAALRALLGEVVRASVGASGGMALAEIEQRSLDLCAQKAEQLVARGFPADYLDEIVHCRRCGDSGYLPDGSMCACLRDLYEAERRAAREEALRSSAERFSDFRLDYYGAEAREVMSLTLDFCRSYAALFGPDSPNLLFQGGTGLGKTFLANCVAKVVLERGFSVCFETVLRAFEAFESQKFSRDAESYADAARHVQAIRDCDLLILDDLGTELTTNFTQSALYDILDSRLTAGKKMIFSTNLSDAELEARYMPQIISRLNGEFDTVLFKGRDIRAIRKELRYR